MEPLIFRQDSGTKDSDHFSIAESSFSDGTVLSPRISRDRLFVPYRRNTQYGLGNAQAYRAIAQDLGAQLQCVQADLHTESYIKNVVDCFVVPQVAPHGRRTECKGIKYIYGRSK